MLHVVLSFLALAAALIALFRALCDHFLYTRRIKELHRRTLEAEKLLRQRAEMAGEVAHEIKNPITAILCSAETLDLLIGQDLDPVHRKSLKFIKEYGDQLLQLVSDFLDVSKIEGGRMEASPERIEIFETVQSVIGLLESNAIKKQIEIASHKTKDNLLAHADPKHIKQVLFNLIHNAIKFTPQNGEVRVVVKSDFPNPFIRIAVKDNGPGIPENQLAGLFDPFSVGGTPGEGLDTGTGLGLALCKSLVELAGGKLSVRSSEGVGSCFEFTVPAYIPEEKDKEMTALLQINQELPAIDRPLRGKRFLIVDEDSGARETVARLLEAWGGVVDRVSMAVEAVEALGKTDYDTVMIDDSVDGVYGYELARMIRDDFNPAHTKIIVTTRSQIDPKLAKSSGADDCVEKPLNGKSLLKTLLGSDNYFLPH